MRGRVTSSLNKPATPATAVRAVGATATPVAEPATTPWSPGDFGGSPGSGGHGGDSATRAASALERQLTEAYDLGAADGRREAQNAERARLQTAVQAADKALSVIVENEERWTGGLDENIAALAVAVARHIVDREIATDRTIVTKLVRRALGEFPVNQPLRIRVNPDDLKVIEANREKEPMTDPATPARDVQWTGDPRIEAGGCVVEGRDRIIDGRVDTALERAYRRLASTDA